MRETFLCALIFSTVIFSQRDWIAPYGWLAKELADKSSLLLFITSVVAAAYELSERQSDEDLAV